MAASIKVDPRDNVAIAAAPLAAGTEADGVITLCDIPRGHKIALCDLPVGTPVIRYGAVIAYTTEAITRGGWVNERNTRMPVPPELDEMHPTGKPPAPLPKAPRDTFMGYRVPGSEYAGIRNYLGIMTTVQCAASVVEHACDYIRKHILPKYPNVDDVVPITHAYGCGVAIDAPDAHIPINALRNVIRHPNLGGEIMVVGLGCEKLSVERLLDGQDITPENVLMLQDCAGYAAMLEAICRMAEPKLRRLNQRRRESLPLSMLCIGMQCGGSDAFSGITANPAAGWAADMIVGAGGTVLISEVTEIRDAVYLLAERTVSEPVCRKLTGQMRWYDEYLERGGVDRGANTTPGNKAGGLSNIVEKAMGSVAKGGTAPISGVLSHGERPSCHGLIYAATSASDIVCGPMQVCSGIALQVFMTGRGTPYGLALAPVIKVSSGSPLADKWQDLIDVDAGGIVERGETIEQVGLRIFNMIIDTASGTHKPWAEKWGLVNYMAVFNPAPIT